MSIVHHFFPLNLVCIFIPCKDFSFFFSLCLSFFISPFFFFPFLSLAVLWYLYTSPWQAGVDGFLFHTVVSQRGKGMPNPFGIPFTWRWIICLRLFLTSFLLLQVIYWRWLRSLKYRDVFACRHLQITQLHEADHVPMSLTRVWYQQ